MDISSCNTHSKTFFMKTTFLLIRHGEAEHNTKRIMSSFPEKRERHLTERGREQVGVLARELDSSGESIAVIFHSPLARTRETAGILAEVLEVPLREDVRLCETCFGVFNDGAISRFHDRYPRKTDRIRTDGSDGVESFADERKRAEAFAYDAIAEYGGKTIVAVSHADTIQTLYGVLKQLSLDETFSSEKGICLQTGEMIRVEVEGREEGE